MFFFFFNFLNFFLTTLQFAATGQTVGGGGGAGAKKNAKKMKIRVKNLAAQLQVQDQEQEEQEQYRRGGEGGDTASRSSSASSSMSSLASPLTPSSLPSALSINFRGLPIPSKTLSPPSGSSGAGSQSSRRELCGSFPTSLSLQAAINSSAQAAGTTWDPAWRWFYSQYH